MKFLRKSLKISQKLPLMIVASALISCVAVGTLSYVISANALHASAENKLSALLDARRQALTDYLASIRQDMLFQANNPAVREALKDFSLAWTMLGDNPTAQLQKLYIEDNPYPTGEKENLDRAGDSSEYSDIHGQYHPWFRQFLRERGYYDVFLFDPDGSR